MNWLTNFVRPKIQALVSNKKDVPDNLWEKCPECEGMLFHRDLSENMNVCYHCGHHMKMSVEERLEALFDEGKYKDVSLPKVPYDPLKFRDRKKYTDRLRDAQSKATTKDAILVGQGKIGGANAVVAAFNFSFMGGSMGAAVGEGIVAAAKKAVATKSALIVVPASGGARMQEGALSLMQMPRTIVGVDMVKDAKLPYIVLLTNPTTGGVSASFAMVGDIHISEPGAMIGFAGKRVIEETIREKLPEGFQTAEYLYEHGMVDMVVKRKDLAKEIGKTLRLLMGMPAPDDNGGGKKPAKIESVKTTPAGERKTRRHSQSKNVKKAPRTLAKGGQVVHLDKTQKANAKRAVKPSKKIAAE